KDIHNGTLIDYRKPGREALNINGLQFFPLSAGNTLKQVIANNKLQTGSKEKETEHRGISKLVSIEEFSRAPFMQREVRKERIRRLQKQKQDSIIALKKQEQQTDSSNKGTAQNLSPLDQGCGTNNGMPPIAVGPGPGFEFSSIVGMYSRAPINIPPLPDLTVNTKKRKKNR
ncbi:MAG TPA: hypothetical protein VI112_04015, partial [Bacteroidia bacterium]